MTRVSSEKTVYDTFYGKWFICHKECLSVDEVVRIGRELGVNVLQALEIDGFIRIHRNYNSHLSRYECLFDLCDIDDVYDKVVGSQ